VKDKNRLKSVLFRDCVSSIVSKWKRKFSQPTWTMIWQLALSTQHCDSFLTISKISTECTRQLTPCRWLRQTRTGSPVRCGSQALAVCGFSLLRLGPSWSRLRQMPPSCQDVAKYRFTLSNVGKPHICLQGSMEETMAMVCSACLAQIHDDLDQWFSKFFSYSPPFKPNHRQFLPSKSHKKGDCKTHSLPTVKKQ